MLEVHHRMVVLTLSLILQREKYSTQPDMQRVSRLKLALSVLTLDVCWLCVCTMGSSI